MNREFLFLGIGVFIGLTVAHTTDDFLTSTLFCAAAGVLVGLVFAIYDNFTEDA